MNINSVLDDVQASLLILVGVKWYYGYVLDREEGPLIYRYIYGIYVCLHISIYIYRQREVFMGKME